MKFKITHEQKSQFVFTDRMYKILKSFALLWLPALGTLYFTLGAIWNLPNVEEVIGTMSAVDAFLGVLLGVSTKAYESLVPKYDGHIAVSKNPETNAPVFSLELDDDPSSLLGKDKVVFRIGKL
jgi:hypothetical protein